MSQAQDLLNSLSVEARVTPTSLVEPVDSMLLTDTATGKIYQLTITNGELKATEVS